MILFKRKPPVHHIYPWNVRRVTFFAVWPVLIWHKGKLQEVRWLEHVTVQQIWGGWYNWCRWHYGWLHDEFIDNRTATVDKKEMS